MKFFGELIGFNKQGVLMSAAIPQAFARATFDVSTWSFGGVSIILAIAAVALAWRHINELRRARRDIERAQHKTEELRTQMLAALELHEVIVTDEELERCVRHLSTEFSRLLEDGDRLQIRLARREVERAAQLVRMGAEGHLMVGADTFSDAETLASIILDTTEEGDEFWASSLVDSEFWTHAAAYVRQQHEKIDDGVTINRVFVFESTAAFEDHEAQRQMTLQREAKINVEYAILPKLAARDLVVVRKRAPDFTGSNGDAPAEIAAKLIDTYALECRVGKDKRIEHIDLWSANDLQSEMVKRTWWTLQSIFSEAASFKPDGAQPTESPPAPQ
jgi:hypothetical protein